MTRSIIALCCAVIWGLVDATGPATALAAEFHDDFNSGLNPSLWQIGNRPPWWGMDSSFSIGASGGAVTIAKPLTDYATPRYTTVPLRFKGTISGDFDARIDFSDLTLSSGASSMETVQFFINFVGSGGNFSWIFARGQRASNGWGPYFVNLAFTKTDMDMASGPGSNLTATAGTLRLARTGPTIEAFLNDMSLGFFTETSPDRPDVQVGVFLTSDSNHPISATFDNFSLSANAITVPEPHSCLILAAAALLLYRPRRAC